jgi:hypothetical protein
VKDRLDTYSLRVAASASASNALMFVGGVFSSLLFKHLALKQGAPKAERCCRTFSVRTFE